MDCTTIDVRRMTASTVRIIKNWDFPDLMRQSPGASGVWNGVRFFEGEGDADYVVVLNQPAAPLRVNAARNRLWAIIQEPPTRYHRYLHHGQQAFGRVYTSDPARAGTSARFIGSQPALAWHAGLDFDTLSAMLEAPPKTRDVSWVTSTLSFLPGHKLRLRSIEALQPAGLVDFYGRGLKPIERKWEALAPYRYSIAFENHIGPWYWSEKIADCFLAGAMPIYAGCSNLEDYFPAGSFVRLDPNSPDVAGDVRRIVESDLAERNRDLVWEARRRVLHELQFFPFVADKIKADKETSDAPSRIEIKVRGISNPVVYGMAVWHWKVAPLLRALRTRIKS